MKIVFLGTPSFAIPSLEALYNSKQHQILAVVCQVDKMKDRKGNIVFSPVKKFALDHKLNLFQFEKISRDGIEAIKNLNPDIMITASYGQILNQELIDIPKFGIINVHGSLLPKYRGASPVQSAVIDGETETGITIMQTEAGLDTGAIISVEKVAISPDETAGELMQKLSSVGAKLLLNTLDKIENGTAKYIPQSHVNATFTTKITKKTAFLNFQKSAKELKNQILGMNPEPIAYAMFNNEIINVYRAKVADVVANENCGQIIEPTSPKNGLFVQCNKSVLEITELQFAGGKIITGKDAVNGKKLSVGDVFGATGNIR